MSELEGCSHREHKDSPPCNKVCDAGETLCPHHLVLSKMPRRKPPAPATAIESGRKFRTPRGYDV
jgi:hypothetical protein